MEQGKAKENKLEIISGECPSCFEETEFKYIGPQETLGEPLYLYNCQGCGSTLVLDSIEQYNQSRSNSTPSSR